MIIFRCLRNRVLMFAVKKFRERRSMENGFMIDEKFRGHKVDDLCVTGLKIILKTGRKNGIRI